MFMSHFINRHIHSALHNLNFMISGVIKVEPRWGMSCSCERARMFNIDGNMECDKFDSESSRVTVDPRVTDVKCMAGLHKG
jgi:hypothetical protein